MPDAQQPRAQRRHQLGVPIADEALPPVGAAV
jgi:hypothetical protein